MTPTKFILLFIAFISIRVACTFAQSNPDTDEKNATHSKTPDELKKEIEAINLKTEQLYLTENINSLINLYVEQLTFFPEYKQAILEIEDLEDFYEDWFKLIDITAYKKKIYTVEAYSNYVLEIGTFNLNFSSRTNSSGKYNGKYMILWKRDSKGSLRILSEAFGADQYIEPEDVPYADIQVAESNFVAKHTVSNQLLKEIDDFNNEVIKAVAEGDAETRANGFTKDAMIMENFDSIRVGQEAIRPIMFSRYKPGTSYIVKHTYYRIYDLGEYVFINGHYKGSWGDSTHGGRFDGNMSNLMKRNGQGVLKMYRQASNRDSKTVLIGS